MSKAIHHNIDVRSTRLWDKRVWRMVERVNPDPTIGIQFEAREEAGTFELSDTPIYNLLFVRRRQPNPVADTSDLQASVGRDFRREP